MAPTPPAIVLPTPLSAYPPPSPDGLLATLVQRASQDPFDLVATAIFALAIIHTFSVARFTALAHRVQHARDERAARDGRPPRPSTLAEFLHFFGEVEVVFGLWAIVLGIAILLWHDFDTLIQYFNQTVNYTEPIFVVVIMALAATRPVVVLAESALKRVASLGRGTPAAWWLAILTIGPVLGSLITEPAAMTICALLLGRQIYERQPSRTLKYATLGLLFVNVSIGGTLTNFAAPPVLMVARLWHWDSAYMLGHIGWRSAVAIVVSNLVYFAVFRKEFVRLAARPPAEADNGDASAGPIPAWITLTHCLFIAWTVVIAHYPALVIGAFLIFLGFTRATAPYQGRFDLKAPLLVGFFLAGLVIHGGLQGWWIQPFLGSLSEESMFFGSILLTAFDDNALITYLATLVPNLTEQLKIAVVEGAVAGGGLTIIANAPNPAGQAILSKYFGGAVYPIGLFLGALLPTIVTVIMFRVM
ncbi:MAG: putative Na+/H+ antiporter [Vicinamibacterales bacterium]